MTNEKSEVEQKIPGRDNEFQSSEIKESLKKEDKQEVVNPKGKTPEEIRKQKDSNRPKISKIAVLRIRGSVGVKTSINDTMKMLKLYKKNSCSIYKNTKSNMGMILKAKDYITWGELDPETEKQLISKGDGKTTFIRLNPPKGGFEKKGIKQPFNLGGALGYRKSKINDLLKKMM